MKKNRLFHPTQEKIVAFKEMGNLLGAAIAELDLRGSDDRVTKAMSIVHEVTQAMVKGKRLTPPQACSLALCYLKAEYQQNI